MTTKRPNSMHRLDNALKRMTPNEKAYVNTRSLVANAIVASMMPSGAIKGGSSLKVRFGDALTRFTTDLDTAKNEELGSFIDSLESALGAGWCGFAGRVVPREQANPKDVPAAYVMQPFDIKLSYLGKSWCTVTLEIGHDEIGDADDPDYIVPVEANKYLENLGFPALGPLACMSLEYQIAQKLHGACEPRSKRAHDLIDLQVIVAHGKVDWEKVRNICVRLFAYRRQLSWPPTVEVREGWESLYLEQATGLDVIQNVDEAVKWANELIVTIEETVSYRGANI